MAYYGVYIPTEKKNTFNDDGKFKVIFCDCIKKEEENPIIYRMAKECQLHRHLFPSYSDSVFRISRIV